MIKILPYKRILLIIDSFINTEKYLYMDKYNFDLKLIK